MFFVVKSSKRHEISNESIITFRGSKNWHQDTISPLDCMSILLEPCRHNSLTWLSLHNLRMQKEILPSHGLVTIHTLGVLLRLILVVSAKHCEICWLLINIHQNNINYENFYYLDNFFQKLYVWLKNRPFFIKACHIHWDLDYMTYQKE